MCVKVLFPKIATLATGNKTVFIQVKMFSLGDLVVFRACQPIFFCLLRK